MKGKFDAYGKKGPKLNCSLGYCPQLYGNGNPFKDIFSILRWMNTFLLWKRTNEYVHIQINERFPNSYFLAPLCLDHFMDILLDYRLYKSLKVTPLKNPLYWKISEHSFDEIHRILLGELFCKIFELWMKLVKKNPVIKGWKFCLEWKKLRIVSPWLASAHAHFRRRENDGVWVWSSVTIHQQIQHQ